MITNHPYGESDIRSIPFHFNKLLSIYSVSLKHMTSRISLFISLFIGNALYGQSNARDSTAADLSCLRPSSVTIALTYVPSLSLDTCSQNLVNFKNDRVEMELLELMKDSTLVLPVHVILTERHHISSSLSESFQYKKDSLIGFVFTYNKLVWSKNASTGDVSLSEKSIQRCRLYWRKKIIKENRKGK